jgi:hypothetical protein
LVPHEAAPLSWQTPRGSRLSAATVMQKPGEVGSAQYWHVPLQALSQQTPSTQKLLEHSLAAWQLAPIGLGPQVLAMHAVP